MNRNSDINTLYSFSCCSSFLIQQLHQPSTAPSLTPVVLSLTNARSCHSLQELFTPTFFSIRKPIHTVRMQYQLVAAALVASAVASPAYAPAYAAPPAYEVSSSSSTEEAKPTHPATSSVEHPPVYYTSAASTTEAQTYVTKTAESSKSVETHPVVYSYSSEEASTIVVVQPTKSEGMPMPMPSSTEEAKKTVYVCPSASQGQSQPAPSAPAPGMPAAPAPGMPAAPAPVPGMPAAPAPASPAPNSPIQQISDGQIQNPAKGAASGPASNGPASYPSGPASGAASNGTASNGAAGNGTKSPVSPPQAYTGAASSLSAVGLIAGLGAMAAFFL
ncbi:hypothetical protein TI39_contig4101g00004 [Zymoseptoria brevis]|uniref:Uncharacterized protein n=1 Tax=Zymoseptoria brevis TaxID=1047168 RepID=A0A0F4GDW6_9PEZI|nr:hypothetical protein TI39_contig4101g00004 [Zymoseptoria brevis]